MEYNSRYLPAPMVIQSRVQNKGEPHLGVVLALDLSSSMRELIPILERALIAFKEEISKHYISSGRVDFCLVTYSDTVQVPVSFGLLRDVEFPNLIANGTTAMHAAISKVLDEVNAREQAYASSNTIAYRPIVMLMTDGYATDKDSNGVVERLREAQKQKKLHFFPVGIGAQADTAFLKRLNVNGTVLKSDPEVISGALQWLSKTVIEVSTSSVSRKDTRVSLDDPRDFQISVM